MATLCTGLLRERFADVRNFVRRNDLAAGLLRFHCPDSVAAVCDRRTFRLHLLGPPPLRTGQRYPAAGVLSLLSYFNQSDHESLDRHRIKELLQQIMSGTMEPSPVEIPRAEHLAQLKRLCDSGLERQFLDFLVQHHLRLPERAQHYYEKFGTGPDFSYTGENPAFIYVDGPPHDYPDRQTRDAAQTTALTAEGITVIRFHHAVDWESVVSRYPSVFGKPIKKGVP